MTSHILPQLENQGIGGIMDCCSPLPHQAALSGGAGVCPSEPRDSLLHKSKPERKECRASRGIEQFVAFPFSMGPVAHKTAVGQCRKNTPASREDLFRLQPHKGYTDGILQKPPHWLPQRCQKISAYLLCWPFERDQGVSH